MENQRRAFDSMLASGVPMLALAPMQDVTDLPFWALMSRYGGPDIYFTEYFRVTPNFKPGGEILRSITENPTGRPAVAQMIGNDVPSLVETAKRLQDHPVAAIDLNLGCPAPVVYRKSAGGGLLRDPARVDAILGALREAVKIRFTVKTRIGFDDPAVFDELLPIFARHSLDMLTVHARTVKEMYRSEVHYEFIGRTVDAMGCPVLANGNVCSAAKAETVLRETNAAGLMIGRGAIRNPWMFTQIRQRLNGEPVFIPTGREVLGYVRDLFENVTHVHVPDRSRVQKMKKYMNYFGIGVDREGAFVHRIRRARDKDEFFEICGEFLDHDRPMPLDPFNLDLPSTDLLAGVHR